MATARPDVYTVASGSGLYAGAPAPAPAPSPAPAPAPAVGSKYRSGQPLLLQSVDQEFRPAVYGDPFPADVVEDVGPTDVYVARAYGWKWANVGGSWLDSTLTPQGATPWAAIAANGSTPTSFTGTVTTLAQHVRANGKPMALLLTGASNPRSIAGRTAATKNAITYNYTDSTSETLNATTVATAFGSTSPATAKALHPLPCFVEFPAPKKDVSSATLSVRVEAFFGGNSDINVQLLNPPRNTDADTATGLGLAASAGTMDAGLSSVSGVDFSHRFEDSLGESAYLVRQAGANLFSESNYSPEFWGGAVDTSKWPYASAGTSLAGKWLVPAGADGRAQNIEVITSAQVLALGLPPIAPGIGALKVTIPNQGVASGAEVDNNGTFGADAKLFLPAAQFGTRSHVFSRSIVTILSPSGTVPGDRREYLKTGLQVFEDRSGKFGFMPDSSNTYGGSRGSENFGGGGNVGLLVRWMWRQMLAGVTGPDSDAFLIGLHMLDDWRGDNNPVGHRYGKAGDPGFMGNQDERWGQRGGLGASLKLGQRYLIETEFKLNDATDSSFTPNGEIRAWIDGRLVFELTGKVFRTRPVSVPAYNASKLRPCRELGFTGHRLNHFHGGQTPFSSEMVVLYEMMAAGTSRIGAPKGWTIPQALPSWVPAYSATQANVATLTVANSRLQNNAASVCAPYYDSFRFPQIFAAYSGGTYNPHWGVYGAMHYYGTGHAAGNDNTVPTLVLGEVCYWRRLNDPSPIYGTGTDVTTQGNNAFADFSGLPQIDPPTCTYAVDGQAAGQHSYGNVVILPPTIAAPQGRLFTPLITAAARNLAVTTSAVSANRIDINSALASSAMQWVHMGVHPTLGYGPALNSSLTAPTHAAYDAPRNRTLYVSRQPGPVRWYDHTAGSYVEGTGTGLDASDFGTIAAHVLVHVPQRDLLLIVYRKTGGTTLGIKWMDLSATQPAWVNTGATLSAAINVDADWSAACWCVDNSRVLVGDLQGNRGAYFEIDIPATLSSTWACTQVNFSQDVTTFRTSRTSDNATDYGKWAYVPALKCLMHFNHHHAAGAADTVFAIRPRGV